MACNTGRRVQIAGHYRLAMRRRKIFSFFFAMTLAAALDDVRRVEFRPRSFRRLDVVFAVAIFAHLAYIGTGFCEDGAMEGMFRGDILMAVLALNGGDLLLVRNIVRVKTGMASDTNKCPMDGMGENLIVYIQ